MLLFWAIPTSAENRHSIRSVKMSLVYMTSFKNIFKNLEVANYDLAPGHYYYLKCIFILAASASPKRFFRNVHPPPLTVPTYRIRNCVFKLSRWLLTHAKVWKYLSRLLTSRNKYCLAHYPPVQTGDFEYAPHPDLGFKIPFSSKWIQGFYLLFLQLFSIFDILK